jgi:hypothetical protein
VKEEGKFVRIGIAELPFTLDKVGLKEGGWERKGITII